LPNTPSAVDQPFATDDPQARADPWALVVIFGGGSMVLRAFMCCCDKVSPVVWSTRSKLKIKTFVSFRGIAAQFRSNHSKIVAH